MGSTQSWMYVLALYFVFLFTFTTLLSVSGVLSGTGIVANTGNFATNTYAYNGTVAPTDSGTAFFNWGTYLNDMFSFFVWDISIYDSDQDYIMQYWWIVRLFIVWLPLLALILAIYYSLPTVSG